MALESLFDSFLPIFIAFLLTTTATVTSAWQILMHLKYYTEPTYQRYIVRIIFMVPVYATMSFLALVFEDKAIWFNTIRDVYEAWVIYNFLSLCLAWVGGPGAVVTSLNGRILEPSYVLMTCCLPAMPLDGRFIRRCKQGGLQFVFLKPTLAALSLILFWKGKYEDGNWSPEQAYLYITLVYMMSYSLAIYSLILFYVACKELLKPFKPVPKFLMIKSVVFLTYWQGVFLFFLSLTGAIPSERDAANLQNFVICIEMCLAAFGFMIAFPYRPYQQGNVGEQVNIQSSFTHVISMGDVVNDTVHQFAPTYHDYVLYSDGTQENPQRYRTRTFVPTGQEMDALRKQNRATGQLLDDSSSIYSSNPVSRNVSVESTMPTQIRSKSSAEKAENPKKENLASGLLEDLGESQSVVYDLRPVDLKEQSSSQGSSADVHGVAKTLKF